MIVRLIRKRLLGISELEASFERRGFELSPPHLQSRIELIGKTFVGGYNASVSISNIEQLVEHLRLVPVELRGFSYEGAAMGLSILDRIAFSSNKRFNTFLNDYAQKNKYIVHVGAGWAMAKLPWGFRQHFQSLDPLLRWLAVDGYGFHEGYFHWKSSIVKQKRPSLLKGYELNAFDQGLGRSLWFFKGAQVSEVVKCISEFDAKRHADLWSGVGLASAYAGGVSADELTFLYKNSSDYQPQLCQGAIFAAKARHLAESVSLDTELACSTYLGISAKQAALISDEAEKELPPDDLVPAYEIWRQRIQGMIERKREVA